MTSFGCLGSFGSKVITLTLEKVDFIMFLQRFGPCASWRVIQNDVNKNTFVSKNLKTHKVCLRFSGCQKLDLFTFLYDFNFGTVVHNEM